MNLFLPENHSLKGKRSVLKSIQGRVAHEFNASVAECGDQELWQSAVLGFSVIGSSSQVVESTLQQIIEFVDRLNLAQRVDTAVELFQV